MSPTLRGAQLLCARIAAPLRAEGYLVALYGSVLTHGQGKDYDLLLVPWRRGAEPHRAIDMIVGATNGHVVGEPYRGLMGTMAATVHAAGVVIDIQIRELE